jgi:D-3-phosphoglycerate dehydrogenase
VRVLVADRLDPAALEALRRAGHEPIERTGLQGAELIAALDSCAALIVRGSTKVTAEVLRGAPSLRVVVRAGTGIDNIDAAAARERGVVVSNTPAANAVSVAELVFGLLLALERHLVPAAGDLARGRWEKTKYQGRELAGRTMGLLGFGRIAREVAARARAFAMDVIACDPPLADWPATPPARRVDLETLLERSDVLSIHVPLTDGTRGLIGARELLRMRRDAILVQCARGGVVNESALLDALRSGAIRGAALDVFEHEPLPAGNVLSGCPRLLLTPHIAGVTRESNARVSALVAREVGAALLRRGGDGAHA